MYKALFAAILAVLLLSQPSRAVNFVCGQDLNGDGTATDTGETASCPATPQGTFCPVGAVACSATYTPSTCPAGGGLNPATDQCEGPTVPLWRNWLLIQLVGASGVWNFNLSVDLNQDGVSDQAVASPSQFQSVYAFDNHEVVERKACQPGNLFSSCSYYWGLTLQSTPSPSGPKTLLTWTKALPAADLWQVNRSSPFPTRQTAAGYLQEIIRGALAIPSQEIRLQPGSEVFLDGSCFGLGQDRCYSATWERSYPGCPAGYTLVGGVCQAPTTCASGTYDAAKHACYQGNSTCPLGPQSACMNSNGTYQCSPNTCIDLDATPPGSTGADLTGYQNNGQTNPNSGMCMGPVFIFNGKGSECRPSGAGTSFFNCCSNSSGSVVDFLKYCATNERDTNTARDASACHYVGDYCKTSWPFVGCVQKSQVYCCFNSKLGRMIQEQGRGQLKKFSPDGQWGTANSPNCVGFAPEELQMLDFSQMDLSEYFANISTKSQSQINTDLGNKINGFYQNLHP